MGARIQLRRGTATFWASENPILHLGEPGYETDTKKLKIGDGKTPWRDLAYGDASGTTGPKGDTGDTGPMGPQGPAGADGVQGPQGPKGDTGPMGPQGLQGPKGDTGDAGTAGPQGLKGDKGDPGDAGPAGPAGADGAQGPIGLAGPQGDPGPQGLQGLKGDKGDTGDRGPVGQIASNYFGSWRVAPVQYSFNDVVLYQGTTYVAISPAPPTGVSPDQRIGTDWGILGAKGDAGLQWKGTWDGQSIYSANDAVTRNGSTYRAKSAIAAPTLNLGTFKNIKAKGQIASGASVSSAIDASDPVPTGSAAGYYSEVWQYVVTATTTVHINIASPSNVAWFDYSNAAGATEGATFQSANLSRAPGTYYVLVHTTTAGRTTDYTLSITADNPAAVTAPSNIAPESDSANWETLARGAVLGDTGDITGKTSAQIDALFPGVINGSMATGLDGATPIILMRRAGKWHKSAAYTQIT